MNISFFSFEFQTQQLRQIMLQEMAQVYDCFNSKMDEMQAATLSIKINHLSQWNQERVNIANQYLQLLSEVNLYYL